MRLQPGHLRLQPPSDRVAASSSSQKAWTIREVGSQPGCVRGTAHRLRGEGLRGCPSLLTTAYYLLLLRTTRYTLLTTWKVAQSPPLAGGRSDALGERLAARVALTEEVARLRHVDLRARLGR